MIVEDEVTGATTAGIIVVEEEEDDEEVVAGAGAWETICVEVVSSSVEDVAGVYSTVEVGSRGSLVVI